MKSPVSSRSTPCWRGQVAAWFSAVYYLALPVLTLAFVISGALIKMVRTNTMRAMQSDYILYAKASGLPPGLVARYAVRAALTPAITLIGIFYGVLLSAAVTVEVVFSLDGIGQYAIRSVLAFDYPAIQGVVLVVAMVSLLIYLLLDIVHALPRPEDSELSESDTAMRDSGEAIDQHFDPSLFAAGPVGLKGLGQMMRRKQDAAGGPVHHPALCLPCRIRPPDRPPTTPRM